jgi:hypothetical protein
MSKTPARELYRRYRDGFLSPQHLHHCYDLIKCRFVHEPACPCIGKTKITVKIAAVCKVDIRKQSLRMVVAAQPAGRRAAFGWGNILRVFDAVTYGVILIKPVIHRGIRPVEIPGCAMYRTCPFQPDLVLILDNICLKSRITEGAKAPCLFYQHQLITSSVAKYPVINACSSGEERHQ